MADPTILAARQRTAEAQIVAITAGLRSQQVAIEPYPTDELVRQQLVAMQVYALDPMLAATLRLEWTAAMLATLAAALPD